MAGNSGGEVEYILRADDSKIESDMETANKKVEKAAKKSADESVKIEEQKTKDLKRESDKVVKNAEKAASDIADAFDDAGQDAKKALGSIGDDAEAVSIGVDADISEAEKKIDSLEADDMQVDVDANTGKAETAIKSVSKDKSIDVDVDANVSGAKDKIEDLGETGEETARSIGDSLKKVFEDSDVGGLISNVGSTAKSSFSDAAIAAAPFSGAISGITSGLSTSTVAAIGAGAAVVGAGALAVNAANDMQGAMNDFLASTGKSREETERYQGVLEKIYANNYGDSFGDIGQAMAEVTKQLGEMDEADLQNVTESAFALRDTFGYDISESVRAAGTMMDNFGISAEEAMNLIATGAQNGLDYSGELMDSISEYSVQFEKVGLGADDMFAIFQKGAESGAFNLDKVGDAVKEMSIRVVDGSDTTREGFELLGLNADEMAQKFSEGGDSAKEAFEETIDALAAMEDPLAQNTAGVDMFGTMWEDLGPEAVTALADIEEGAYATGEELNTLKDVKYDDLSSQFEGLKRSTELLLVPIGEALIPLLSTLAESVLPLVTGTLAPLINLFVELITPIISLISTAITPLINIFTQLVSSAINPLISVIRSVLVPVFTGSLNSLFSTGSKVIKNITNIFRNLIDFVKNVFTKNWRGAWNNIKSIFSNAVSGLVSIFKAPINAIVDGWNKLAKSIGSVSVPDWVPGVGGKTFKLPKMSRLKVGLDYVPNDMFPAYLDEGEWVLTKEEANLLRSYGGLESMIAMIDRTSGSIPINVSVQGGESIDYERLGYAVASALIRANVEFKCYERPFARLIGDLQDYV